MTTLDATAKATLRAAGISQAEWARRNWMADGTWSGDACGCTDDRCIGFHHDGPDDCGCLPALLADLLAGDPYHTFAPSLAEPRRSTNMAAPWRPAQPSNGLMTTTAGAITALCGQSLACWPGESRCRTCRRRRNPVPERIQLSRKKGSRLPGGARSVARPSFWGNPFKVGALVEDPESARFPPQPHKGDLAPGVQGVGTIGGTTYIFTVRRVASRADAVALFIAWARHVRDTDSGQPYAELARRDLGGLSLACWCPLDGDPCHAAPLMDMAAGRRTRTPDVTLPDGHRRIHVKRCCNGCGQEIGDVTDAEIACAVAGRPLPDVRGECPRCSLAVNGAR